MNDGAVAAETVASPANIKGLSAGAYALFSLLVILLAAYCGVVLQSDWAAVRALGFSGFFVPDAVGLASTVDLAWKSDWQSWPHFITLLGVVLLYGPATVLGSWAATGINVLLLWCASQIFLASLYSIFDTRNARQIALLATALVASNIYIIEILQFPNKEIPLLLLSNVVLYVSVAHGSLLPAAVLSMIVYVFRDGYAMILLVAMTLLFCRKYLGRIPALIMLAAMPTFMILLPISDLAEVDSAVGRNVEIGEAISGDKFESLGLFSYLARLAGNVANLGLRPQMVDVSGGIYVLGIGFWQFGVVLLSGLLWAGYNVFSSDAKRAGTALVIVASILGIAYGSFVQPRYMMPLMFWLSLGMVESRIFRWVSLVSCTVAPMIFLALGGLPPLAGG